MKSFSEETRRKMSESAKRRCADPAWIEAQKNRGTKLDFNAVKTMYERGMTQAEIAAELHTTQKIVFNFMRRHGIKARIAAKREQTRENNAHWKGGARIEGGYKCLYIPGHHKARTNGYVREHDLIAEKMIGRPLRWFGPRDSRSEIVHHINGDKLDNRPENLLILSPQQHRDIHNAVTKEMVDVALLKRIHDLETEIKQIERIHDKGSCLWASEIEEFPIAVTKHHFPDEEKEKQGD